MKNPFLSVDPHDLLDVTSALVDHPSITRDEELICSNLHEWISSFRPDARITRLSNSLVVRLGPEEDSPVIFAGHTDTVVSAEFEDQLNNTARIVGDKLFGLGTADMKSGLAVMIALLADIQIASTFVFYEAEEGPDIHNGLRLIVEQQPELVKGKWAILLEPTNGGLEMGCQGAITVTAKFAGQQAHSARPWMGINAIHKAVDTITAIKEASSDQAQLEIEGLTYSSTLQITKINGGVAANIIPGSCDVTINHRFVPSTTPDEAEAYIRDLCSEADEIVIPSRSAGAMPAFDHPVVAFAQEKGRVIEPKVAWTDVARFYELGIPAVNCGPGDPAMCHRADEYITIEKLDETYQFLREFLGIK